MVGGHGAAWLCSGALLLAEGLSCFGCALVPGVKDDEHDFSGFDVPEHVGERDVLGWEDH